MKSKSAADPVVNWWTRRKFLKAIAIGGIGATAGFALVKHFRKRESRAEAFIASVPGYGADIRERIIRGCEALGVTSAEINGKRVLIKPNLVEPHSGISHINTHPLVVRAAVEAFLYLGAAKVVVAEGAGHRRDSLLVLEESGLADVLYEDRIPFIDLNSAPVIKARNLGGKSGLNELYLPHELARADITVSLAKMKTHHWAGVTLSMKNLFGIMPGIIYGWPKNIFHWVGINKSIVDINATVRPELAIVDGIVGMEGDGPIMGDPVEANVIVMGRNLPAVDATCARIMGIDPQKIPYLISADNWLGPIRESSIEQRGESIASMRTNFQLFDFIPSHRGIRLVYQKTNSSRFLVA
jgi:uncharacterized protein (DUF362 family)